MKQRNSENNKEKHLFSYSFIFIKYIQLQFSLLFICKIFFYFLLLFFFHMNVLILLLISYLLWHQSNKDPDRESVRINKTPGKFWQQVTQNIISQMLSET